MSTGSESRITLPRAVAALLLVGCCAYVPAALAQPNVKISTSVQSLAAQRQAGIAKLPKVQQQREPRTYDVISHLPLVLQEAYLTTLQDYPKLVPADQKKFISIVDTLGALPKSTQTQAASLLNAQFPSSVSADRIAKARSHPHETCWLINAAIAKARAQVRP